LSYPQTFILAHRAGKKGRIQRR